MREILCLLKCGKTRNGETNVMLRFKEFFWIVIGCLIIAFYAVFVFDSSGAHSVGYYPVIKLEKIKIGDYCHNCRKLFFENTKYMFCSTDCERQYRIRQELIKKERKEIK